MTATATQFPAFLNVEYQPDSNGFPKLDAEINAAFDKADRKVRSFTTNMAAIEQQTRNAIAGSSTGLTKGLDFDVPGLQRAAAVAQRQAEAMREVVSATRLASLASSQHGQAAAAELGNVERLAEEYAQKAQAARQMALAMEGVQQQLDRTGAASTRLAISGQGMSLAMQKSAVSAGQMRMASIGAGQQLTDLAVQIGSGQRASTAFAQQLPQLGFALSMLAGHSDKTLGRLGAFGAFMSGPWGAAITVGAFVVGGLVERLFEVDDASDSAAKATDEAAAAFGRAAAAVTNYRDRIGELIALQGKGTAIGIGEAKVGLMSLEAQLAALDSKIASTVGGRAKLQERNRLSKERQALAAEIESQRGLMSALEIQLKNRQRYDDAIAASKASTKPSGTKSGRKPYDTKKALSAFLYDADRDITADIAKQLDQEASRLERLGSVGDQIAEDRARQREIEQADAERLVATYSQLLGISAQVGGAIGDIAGAVNGIITGNFGGLGKAGALVQLTTAGMGPDGWKSVTAKLDEIFGGAGGDGTFARTMTSVLQSASIGMTASSLILGGSGSNTGAAIGGALGKKVGEKFLSKGLEGIAKGLGKFAGPLGSIAGGLLGGVVGGLFKKTRYGTVSIGQGADGNLGITGSSGNSKTRIANSTKSADVAIGTLESIAEQLGVSVDASKGSVSIGQYKKKWRVRDDAFSGKLDFKGSSSIGLHDFGDDAQAAAEYATLNLIQDGVLVGLRKGTQMLLSNAKDLQEGMAKALKFENVFRDLKRMKDPVGAAIDDLNREFESLISIFKQAGATAEETSQLEELYGLKRKAAVEDAFKSLTGSLKDLLNEITIGDSGYSLRSRLASAQAEYNPLAARVQAGDTAAYDDFTMAARSLMDISREYYGSGTEYFALLDQVKQISQGQLDLQQRQYDSATGTASPFDTTPIVSAVDSQTDKIAASFAALMQASNDNSAKQIAAMQQAIASLGGVRAFRPGAYNF